MAASSSSSTRTLLLLILLSSLSLSVESRLSSQPSPRPSPRKHDTQVLDNLFSAQLRSLILHQPDITSEGSTSGPSHSYHPPSQGLAGRGMGAGPVVPRLFLDFLRQQRMFRGRSRKSATARGCFGMKVDRIGSVSGLGC
ncbi:C-type natriuretic peptide 2 [Oncorhynchus tshawytscha]|uniref:C-type natriuretic peptide 2 n=1 Tax=Oncorhynchus tshawytscha TaxID=74940 RepID=UPI001C3CD36D|nr:C-type natriuretic peptide 2 [Oncorhynchus tshawytscha]